MDLLIAAPCVWARVHFCGVWGKPGFRETARRDDPFDEANCRCNLLIVEVMIWLRSPLQLEVGRAWARAQISDSGILLNKTLSPNQSVRPKPDFFIYMVKPEPD
jgi:hypothetical protein